MFVTTPYSVVAFAVAASVGLAAGAAVAAASRPNPFVLPEAAGGCRQVALEAGDQGPGSLRADYAPTDTAVQTRLNVFIEPEPKATLEQTLDAFAASQLERTAEGWTVAEKGQGLYGAGGLAYNYVLLTSASVRDANNDRRALGVGLWVANLQGWRVQVRVSAPAGVEAVKAAALSFLAEAPKPAAVN
jgi:hypothetical protein